LLANEGAAFCEECSAENAEARLAWVLLFCAEQQISIDAVPFLLVASGGLFCAERWSASRVSVRAHVWMIDRVNPFCAEHYKLNFAMRGSA
jgi:hypothetical protein